MKEFLRKTIGYVIVFLVGFFIVPGYCFIQYTVKEVDGEGLLLLKKTSTASPFLQSEKRAVGKSSAESSSCARNRWLIKTAVMEHNRRSKKMTGLNLFELIREKRLKEMPNCPGNGIYSVSSYSMSRPIISCSIHGITEAH